MVTSSKKYKLNNKVPKIDLSRVEVEESDEEEDIDKMIEEAIEVELEQNPDIANQFESMEDFKRYIFDKQFNEYNQDKESADGTHSQYASSSKTKSNDKNAKQQEDVGKGYKGLDMNVNVSLGKENENA